jgi:hypothetical protein
MSITLKICPVVGKPFQVSVPAVGSTVADLKAAIALLREDLPVRIQALFLGDVVLPRVCLLDNVNVKDGTEIRLLRNETLDDSEEIETSDEEEEAGSLDGFIVSDDVELDDEDEEEEEEELEGEGAEGAEGEGGGGAEVVEISAAKIGLKTRGKKRPLVDVDPVNIIEEGQRRNRRAVARFVHPDLLRVVKNEDLAAAESESDEEDSGSGSGSEADSGSHTKDAEPEDGEFVPSEEEDLGSDLEEEEEEEFEDDDEEEEFV